MCGIFCSLLRDGCQITCDKQLLKNRGPDAYNEINCSLKDNWNAVFAGSTLWTQGPKIQPQPLVHSNGSILLWNGDKYSDTISSELDAKFCANDSEEVLSGLLDSGVIDYLKNLTGPYSFIFYHSKKNELWFGRDVLGRHSLLWSVAQKSIILSSVMEHKSSTNITEVPSCGLFKISLSATEIIIDLYPWTHMVPKETTASAALNVKNLVCHFILGKCTDYLWTTQVPPSSEIDLNNLAVGAENILPKFLQIPQYLNEVNKLKDLLFKSVRRRIITKPNYCKGCISGSSICKHAKIGVLFSGGLDSAILAVVSNYFVPEDEPIDLFNVTFARNSENFDSVPDRKTGRNTLEELRSLCPGRCWNFVEINITQEELQYQRQNHIVNLIYPLNSVLDDSLGCALWFAARGAGILDGQQYTSVSRIILSGIGADEMFGGYSRHRVTYKTKGWNGLIQDLYSDLRNIGERNLGRDNRVVADHGRQLRMPYLDEEFVAAVDSLPAWVRCSFHPKMPRGVGDKLLLRLLAWHLGLRSAASLPKKAFQFGSRIANPKDKGHLASKNLAA